MTVRTGEIDLERLDGRCYVRYLSERAEIEEWIKHDDHFYLNQKGDLRHGLFVIDDEDLDGCEVCQEARFDDIMRVQELFNQNGPLRGLELFSGKGFVTSLEEGLICNVGAGGLGTGMAMSGFVDIKWAVEYSPAAALTYK